MGIFSKLQSEAKTRKLLPMVESFEQVYKTSGIKPLSILLETLLEGLKNIQGINDENKLNEVLESLKKSLRKVFKIIEKNRETLQISDEKISRISETVDAVLKEVKIVSKAQDPLKTIEVLLKVLWSEIQKTVVDLKEALNQLSPSAQELKPIFERDGHILDDKLHKKISKHLDRFEAADKALLVETNEFIKGKAIQQLKSFKKDFKLLRVEQQLEFFKKLLEACYTFKKSKDLNVQQVSQTYDELKKSLQKVLGGDILEEISQQYIGADRILQKIATLLAGKIRLENQSQLFVKAFEVLCQALRLSMENLKDALEKISPAAEEIKLLSTHAVSLLDPELQKRIRHYPKLLAKDVKDNLRHADSFLKEEGTADLKNRVRWLTSLLDVYHHLTKLKEAKTEEEKLEAFQALRTPCRKVQKLLKTSTNYDECSKKLISEILSELSSDEELIRKAHAFYTQVGSSLKIVWNAILLHESCLRDLLKQSSSVEEIEEFIHKELGRLDSKEQESILEYFELLKAAQTHLKEIECLMFENDFIEFKMQKKLDFFRKSLGTYNAAKQIYQNRTVETLNSFIRSFQSVVTGLEDYPEYCDIFEDSQEYCDIFLENRKNIETLINLDLEHAEESLEDKKDKIRFAENIIQILLFVLESNALKLNETIQRLFDTKHAKTFLELFWDTNQASSNNLDSEFFGKLKYYYDQIVVAGNDLNTVLSAGNDLKKLQPLHQEVKTLPECKKDALVEPDTDDDNTSIRGLSP